MIKRALAIAAATLLLGCEATVATPPPALVASPSTSQPPPLEAPEGDVPFKGTYSRHTKITYKQGKRVRAANDEGAATIQIEAGKVTYDQSYRARDESRYVGQIYAFGTADVRSAGDDGYEIALVFQGITGDTEGYSPDQESPRLVARRSASGWEIGLVTTDLKGVHAGAEFSAEPTKVPASDESGWLVGPVLLARLGLKAPPDVAAAPADAEHSISGLASKVLAPGTGTIHPRPEEEVKIHYSGWTRNGLMFDSSRERGQPASLRPDQLVKGLAEGLQLMVTGETRRFWIPAALGYGAAPRVGFPAGALVFDVELLELTPGPRSPPVPPDVKAPPADAKKTRSGLAYRILKKGTGKRSPGAKDTVVVSYSGWTTDGKLFDSSVARGEPMTFRLDTVIKGWTEGLQLMKAGDVARFWMPADLAYGEHPTSRGAPGGMLVFDIELITVK